MTKGTKLEFPPDMKEGYMYRCQEWDSNDESVELILDYSPLYVKGLTEYEGEQWTIFDKKNYKGTNAFMMRTSDLDEIFKTQNYEIY